MIEHLPSELRDRFFEIREMDLSVQSKWNAWICTCKHTVWYFLILDRVDSLAERQKTFFANCNKKLKAADRDEEFEKIKTEYKKVVEDAQEKVQIAEDCYGLVDRYLRKLDEELLKFKLELEADNRGITEILEKQSLEMDAQPSYSAHPKENRKPKKHKKSSQNTTQELAAYSPTPSQEGPHFGTANFSNSNNFAGAHNSTLSLQHIGIGGNAIAAAASQAIAATQQLSGRRSSSLKASYEAINLGVQTNEFTIGRELAGAAQAAIASTSFDPDPRQNPRKDKDVMNSPGGGYLDVLGGQDSNASYSTDQEWNYDPNEPRYCICNQVSYGDMVACDNDDVSIFRSVSMNF